MLVLSEDQEARTLFRSATEQVRGEVKFAASLDEAHEAIRRHQPGIVVFDADAYEPQALARFTNKPKHRATFFVALSSRRDGSAWQTLYRAGFDRFVAKPILLERVEELLGSIYDEYAGTWPLARA